MSQFYKLCQEKKAFVQDVTQANLVGGISTEAAEFLSAPLAWLAIELDWLEGPVRFPQQNGTGNLHRSRSFQT